MNWGHKLFLVFIVFAAGIFYLVYRSMQVNYELVTKEYYKDELHYQEIIDASNRASELAKRVEVTQKGSIIVVQLPDEMKSQNVTGEMWFYCAADEKRDRHISMKLDQNAAQQIGKERFLPGNYLVKLSWKSNNTRYYSEQPLTIL